MKRLLLLGGGHAHAVVLLRLRNFISKNLEVVLVNPGPVHTYSGMVPGVIAGHYAAADAQIDLASLCRRAGAELVAASVASLAPGQKSVTLHDGRSLQYDIASLNLGALPNYFGVPGAREHAIGAKPFEPFLERWNALRGKGARVAIAGAGAAGVELAMAMKFAGAGRAVLFSAEQVFQGELQRRIIHALESRSIELKTNAAVTAVEPGPVVVTAAGRETVDALFWSAGVAALPLLGKSGLACDAQGYVRVDATLRSVSHPEVFAAGDAISFGSSALPKSGVYSVRQGAVLARNLTRVLRGMSLDDYAPQPISLSLISCGGKYAIASRGGWSAEGAWAWHWKDWIDRRWIASFK